jgi:hypothetical protein
VLKSLSVFVLEIMPWVFAGLIGLFLVAGHASSPSRADAKASPAALVLVASSSG